MGARNGCFRCGSKVPAKLRKKDLKPGMSVRNTVSGTTGEVLGDPLRPSRLHPLAASDYVRVVYLDYRGRWREAAWWLKDVELE